jgi:hypothetical protein
MGSARVSPEFILSSAIAAVRAAFAEIRSQELIIKTSQIV